MRFHVVSRHLSFHQLLMFCPFPLFCKFPVQQLGIGSIGTLISHHLRLALPASPISLIVKKAYRFPSTRLYPFGKPERPPITLSVERDGHVTTSESYELEVWHDGRAERIIRSQQTSFQDEPATPPNGPIDSLVVCLKTSATVSALQVLRDRLSPSSVVTLIQNGMGVYDELCASIWPDPKTRPFFVIGTTTHGVSPGQGYGTIHHRSKAGAGELKLGVVPDPRQELDLEAWLWGKAVSDLPVLAPPSSPTLPLTSLPLASTKLDPLSDTLTALLSLSQLSPSLLPIHSLHHQLLLKVALNSVINPLTAILGAGSLPNGALFGSAPSHRLIRDLTHESSDVLTAYLHSLSAPHSPPFDVIRLFSWEGLERRILALIHATSNNTSSMAVDVSRGRTTEIEHINGYLIALGKRLGVETPRHRMVREMVKFTAEVNGLKPDVLPKTMDRVSDRRERIQSNLGRRRKLTVREMDLEEKRLELKERKLWLAEEQMAETKRARRRAAKKGPLDEAKTRNVAVNIQIEGTIPAVSEEEAAGAESTLTSITANDNAASDVSTEESPSATQAAAVTAETPETDEAKPDTIPQAPPMKRLTTLISPFSARDQSIPPVSPTKSNPPPRTTRRHELGGYDR